MLNVWHVVDTQEMIVIIAKMKLLWVVCRLNTKLDSNFLTMCNKNKSNDENNNKYGYKCIYKSESPKLLVLNFSRNITIERNSYILNDLSMQKD